MLSAPFALLGKEACKGFVLPLRDVGVNRPQAFLFLHKKI